MKAFLTSNPVFTMLLADFDVREAPASEVVGLIAKLAGVKLSYKDDGARFTSLN